MVSKDVRQINQNYWCRNWIPQTSNFRHLFYTIWQHVFVFLFQNLSISSFPIPPFCFDLFHALSNSWHFSFFSSISAFNGPSCRCNSPILVAISAASPPFTGCPCAVNWDSRLYSWISCLYSSVVVLLNSARRWFSSIWYWIWIVDWKEMRNDRYKKNQLFKNKIYGKR